MGVYAGVTDDYLTQSYRVADSVEKYRLWSLAKEGDPGKTPALDLNFAENKSLVDDISGNNLITFTRSSAATYVDSNGLIKTAGLNLLLNSNKLNQFFTSGVAYGGGYGGGWQNDPEDITELTDEYGKYYNTSYSLIWSSYGTCNTSSSTGYVISFFAKSSTTANIRPRLYSNVNGNVSTGTYVSLQTGGTEYPGGWRKFEFDMPTTTNTGNSLIIELSTGTGFDIKNIQVEEGDTATVYADTTSSASGAPRFDHDPDTGESLGLLIEEERTNVFLNSKSFSGQSTTSNVISSNQIYWGFSGSGTLTTNAATAPDGTNTASLVSFSASNAYVFSNASSAPSSLQGSRICLSMFAKPHPNNSSYSFTLRQGGGNDYDVTFNLDPNGSSQTFTDGYSIKYPNGWYRVVINKNVTTGGALLFYWANRTTDTYYVWGAQGENGAFATTYIPTTSSEVTRSVDSALLDTSNWWDYTKGTAYAEYRGGLESNQSGYGRVWSPSGAAHFIAGQASHVNNNRHSVWFGGSTVNVVGQEHLISFAKNAITYSNNGTNCDIVNASYPSSATGTTNSSVTSTSHGIGRNSGATTNMLNGHIKRMTYWEQVLDPSTLQSITE